MRSARRLQRLQVHISAALAVSSNANLQVRMVGEDKPLLAISAVDID